MPVLYNNSLFSPTANITECGVPLAQWQSEGNDPGSTAAVLPSDADLEQAIRTLLGF
jgi:hypothetical protein